MTLGVKRHSEKINSKLTLKNNNQSNDFLVNDGIQESKPALKIE